MVMSILLTLPSSLYLTGSKNMETNFKFKTFLATLIILVGLVSVPLSFLKANSGISLYVTPSSGNYDVGNLIHVSVMIDTKGETINAVKATLGFNENLEVRSISKSGSIFGLWIEDPSYDNSLRTITFGGAGAGTTYKGSAGKIISITFEAEKAGKGTISFSSSSVKYGATTIEVESATGASYTINTPCSCSSWQKGACGEGNCSSVQRFQMRTCTPSGCALESRCIDDPNCLPISEIEKPSAEEEITTPEEIIPPKKEIVSGPPPEEKIPQKGLLASLGMAWGEICRSALLTIVTILCLVGLVVIGVREWWLFQKKRKK